MKKIIALLTVLTASLSMAEAQVIFEEKFEYGAADLAKARKWRITREEDNDYKELKNISLNIISNDLEFTKDGANYIGSGEGNALAVDFYASSWVHQQWVTEFKRANKGTLYMSMLLRMDELPLLNNNMRHETQFTTIDMSDGETGRGPMLWIRKVADEWAYKFGLTIGSRAIDDIVWEEGQYTDIGSAHLLVIKYDLSSKTASLYVDPVPGDAEPAPAVVTTNPEGLRALRAIFMYFNFPKANQQYTIGGLRVSGLWSDAVAAK